MPELVKAPENNKAEWVILMEQNKDKINKIKDVFVISRGIKERVNGRVNKQLVKPGSKLSNPTDLQKLYAIDKQFQRKMIGDIFFEIEVKKG